MARGIDDPGYAQHVKECKTCCRGPHCDRGIELRGRRDRKRRAVQQNARQAALKVPGYVGPGEVFKSCTTCGNDYNLQEWRRLKFKGVQHVPEYEAEPAYDLETRDCGCGSTLMAETPAESSLSGLDYYVPASWPSSGEIRTVGELYRLAQAVVAAATAEVSKDVPGGVADPSAAMHATVSKFMYYFDRALSYQPVIYAASDVRPNLYLPGLRVAFSRGFAEFHRGEIQPFSIHVYDDRGAANTLLARYVVTSGLIYQVDAVYAQAEEMGRIGSAVLQRALEGDGTYLTFVKRVLGEEADL